jgi:SsrA-binding protein
MYFKDALVKVEVALCTGKKLFDRREDLKKKAEVRDMQRALRGSQRLKD